MSPFRRLWNIVRRARLDHELRQEFETHLALIEEEEQARGLSAEQARDKARARFGSAILYRERTLDAIIATWLEEAWRDVRFAMRSLLRSSSFTAVALLTLALSLGANTVIFSIVNGALLRPLPYAEPDTLVRAYQANPKQGLRYARVSLRDFQDWRTRVRSFVAMAAYDVVPQVLTGRGDPVELPAAYVTEGFFDVLGAPVQLGRPLIESDHRQAARSAIISDRLWRTREVAIVNASFVERVLHGRNPIGRRIRRAARGSEQAPGPWIEIVGVVPDLGVNGTDGIGLYRPLAPGYSTVHVAIHVRGVPESFTDHLRALASEVEPTLQVYDVLPLDQVGADQWLESQFASRLVAVLSGLALLLSLMAIYSIMAFTVVQRSREIGVRVALGAKRWQIVAAIVRRPLVQIGLGIGAGGALVVLAFVGEFESIPTPVEAGMIAAYAALMLGICLLACVVPTRRALRLEPSQVLRADG